LSGEDFSIEDEATRKIAAQVALKNIAQLKKAQWRLVRTVEDAPLYEALAKQFSKEDGEAEHERRSADAAYLVALIANNRVADAAKFITERREQVIDSGSLLGSDMTTELVRRGLIRQVHGVLRELLQTDAALPFWEDFIELSARLGESDKALAFLRAVAARPNLSPDARRATSRHYAAALLAADEVEEGLKVLREIIQAGPRSGAGDEKSALADLRAQYAKLGVKLSPQDLAQFERFAKQSADTGLSAYLDSCLQLARLGRLLARPEMAEEGVAAAQKALATANAADSDRLHGMEKVAKFLVEQGHGAAAEALASEELARVSKAPMSPQQSYQRGSTQAELLRLLTAIYHRSDRPADVLRLLDAAPWWQAADLAQLVYQSELEVPLGFAGAKALAAAGKKDEARSVVRRVIEHQPGYDPAYRLLLELGGDDLEAWLDTVAQRDRFEERPLIWKARLQLDAGRIDAAEKSVRAAIAIDPSDGEQGKDERMRAYAVLGDILEKKGDAAQAKIMRGAVAAIRLSEKADDWWSAGLLTRAVKMYEEALGHFADAYCIQSRLALRYSELGDYARAEQHYVRAYELMPESFGRIESHCFGCERAFSGERAQGIAERVFTQLATKLPDKAQVFYLLGYLRQEQERPVEAATAFRQAVKLDPDYFNAWEKLHELRDEGVLSAQEIDVAAFAQLRLDPARRHGSISFEGVRDLRGLWNAVLAAETAQPPIASAPLYPLAAAKAERDRRAQAARTARGEEGANDVEDDAMAAGRDRETLRAQFIRHPLLENVAYFLTATKSLQSMRGF
jgi:tetratricopeptide (TPR) repeat protein